jgi:hypothetical protein
LLGIAIDVLVPLDDLGVVPSLHAFHSDMDEVLVIIREQASGLLGLDAKVLGERQ